MENIIDEINFIGALEQASEGAEWHDPHLCKLRRGDAPCNHSNCAEHKQGDLHPNKVGIRWSDTFGWVSIENFGTGDVAEVGQTL